MCLLWSRPTAGSDLSAVAHLDLVVGSAERSSGLGLAGSVDGIGASLGHATGDGFRGVRLVQEEVGQEWVAWRETESWGL